MAPAVARTAIITAAALLISATLVLSAPTTTNDRPNLKLPKPLDVHVVYVQEGEYKLVLRATHDVTDVTTTVSLNKVVTEITDDVQVLKLTKEADGDTWTSPPIRVKLTNKDVLHLGVYFDQEGQKEMQTVNYFEMKIFDQNDKLNLIKDLKGGQTLKEALKGTLKHIQKRAAIDSSDDEEAGGMIISMTMIEADEDANTQELSERWGAHGGYHGHRGGAGGGGFLGNGDFIQLPFVPAKIPSPVDSAFGLFGGLLGGGNQDWNQDQDNGRDRLRPGHYDRRRPSHDWNMDGHHGGGHVHGNDWGSRYGHDHNRGNNGNNGRWPDRHRPNNHNNCHHRDNSDESTDDKPYPSTRMPGPPTRSPWTASTTPSTTRYTTRKTTPTTTTEQVYDIDVRFGQGQAGSENVDPKPDTSDKDLPAAV